MTALHQFTGQYLSLWNEVENEDFDLESLEAALDSLEGEIKQKGTNIAGYIENQNALVASIDDAIKRMQHRKKVIQNKTESLKSYLLRNMQDSGITKIEAPEFCISLKKNPASVEVEDPEQVPDQFKREKVTVTVDKTAIKKAGGCPGARVVDDRYRVEIK